MIKGSAVIELTDADGGKRVIKHDNMVTNAPSDLLKSQRGELATIFKVMSNGESYAKALFGGILLFGDTLNDKADEYFLPTTNIVGYASQEAYGGLDASRGSANQIESGLQADGSYKFVWDFSTSQGNGTIKSIALCPNVMGQIGASDTAVSSERKDFNLLGGIVAPFNINKYMLPNGGTTAGLSNYDFWIVAVNGDIAYAVDYRNVVYSDQYASRYYKNTGNKIKLYRFRLGHRNISVSNLCGMATYIDDMEFTMPDEFVSCLYQGNDQTPLKFWHVTETNKLLVFPCYKNASIPVDGTTKYIEVDIANSLTVKTYTYTNNTAGTIAQNGYSFNYNGGQEYNLFVFKDYILSIASVDGSIKMYVSKRSNNTLVTEVKYSADKPFNSPQWYFSPVFTRNNIVVLAMNVGSYSYPDWYYYVLDMETGIIKQTNANGLHDSTCIDIGDNTVVTITDAYLSYDLLMNPFVLTTKNNLDTPVTKTASQTMKITYTLTESEG